MFESFMTLILAVMYQIHQADINTVFIPVNVQSGPNFLSHNCDFVSEAGWSNTFSFCQQARPAGGFV